MSECVVMFSLNECFCLWGVGFDSPVTVDALVRLLFEVNLSLCDGISLFVWQALHSPYWGLGHSPQI